MHNIGKLGLVAFALVLVGGLNWLLIGLANVNVISLLLGDFSLLVRLIYILVGLSAAYLTYLWVTKKIT